MKTKKYKIFGPCQIFVAACALTIQCVFGSDDAVLEALKRIDGVIVCGDGVALPSQLGILQVLDDQEWVDIDVSYKSVDGERSIVDCFLVNRSGMLTPAVTKFRVKLFAGGLEWNEEIIHSIEPSSPNTVINTMPAYRYELSFPVESPMGFKRSAPICFRIPRHILAGPKSKTNENKRQVTLIFDEVRWCSHGKEKKGRRFVSDPIFLECVDDCWRRVPGKIDVKLKRIDRDVNRTERAKPKELEPNQRS
jgi:hypothetical protein